MQAPVPAGDSLDWRWKEARHGNVAGSVFHVRNGGTQDMTGITQLGYLGLRVSNVDDWEDFATRVLGLQSHARDPDGSLLLRMDDYHHRFIVTPGDEDDLSLVGWEVADEAALRAVDERLAAHGVACEWATPDEAEGRRVVGLLKLHDPNGVATEIFYGPLMGVDTPFQSPRPISGFTTGDMGLGHITMTVDSLEDSLRFYRDALGLRLSDWVRPQPERGVASSLNLAFLHCNARHHSVAFWEGRLPKRLHHFMLQIRTLDDVGATYDLCQDQGVAIDLTLGRHTNDRMLSFYLKSPSGFSVEYGWGAREIDEATWQVQLHRTGSIWGHQHPA